MVRTRQLRRVCLSPAPASPCAPPGGQTRGLALHECTVNRRKSSTVVYMGKDSRSEEEEEDDMRALDHEKSHLLCHDLMVTAGQKWRPATGCHEACVWTLLQPTKISVPSRSGHIWPSVDLPLNCYFLHLTLLHVTVPSSNTRPPSSRPPARPSLCAARQHQAGWAHGSTNLSPPHLVPGSLQVVKRKATPLVSRSWCFSLLGAQPAVKLLPPAQTPAQRAGSSTNAAHSHHLRQRSQRAELHGGLGCTQPRLGNNTDGTGLIWWVSHKVHAGDVLKCLLDVQGLLAWFSP